MNEAAIAARATSRVIGLLSERIGCFNPLPNRRIPDDPDEPSAPPHNRGHDRPPATQRSCCYAAGLRASEVGSLMVADIDSARGVILVRHGKGAKDRNVILMLLGILRVFWRLARPRL